MEPDYAFLMYWATWICRKEMPGWLFRVYTLQGTNISPKNGILKMIFLFPRWFILFIFCGKCTVGKLYQATMDPMVLWVVQNVTFCGFNRICRIKQGFTLK